MRVELRLRAASVSIFILGVAAAMASSSMALHLPENPIGKSTVFIKKGCLHCHSIQGYGGNEGPDLGRLQLSGGFLGMAGVMWNHAPKMIAALAKDQRPLPRFTTEEMRQLVAFLYTLNYLDPPGNARRGEEVFALKR